MSALRTTLLAAALVMLAISAAADVPELVSFQGILTNSDGAPLEGTYAVTFAIYNTASSGPALWIDTLSVTTAANGSFTALLGSDNVLDQTVFNAAERWLGISVESDAEIDPRTQLVSAPYSYRVGTIDGAEGGVIRDDVTIIGLRGPGDLTVSGKATVGPGSTNSGTLSFAAGSGHEVWGNYASVSGGRDNWATQGGTTVSGGLMNNAGDSCATVGGGESNEASGQHATIAGGLANNATSWATFVGGGAENMGDGGYSFIGGGQFNNTGEFGAIGGGEMNYATHHGAVAGGQENAAGFYSAVTGGELNQAGDGSHNSIIGGQSNMINECSWSTIGGGESNSVYGDYAAILGGRGNTIAAAGAYSCLFGIGSSLSEDSTFMVDMPHIRFGDSASGYEFPPADGAPGEILATDGAGQLSWTSASGGSSGWVDYGRLTTLLVEAVKEARAENEDLKQRIEKLESR